ACDSFSTKLTGAAPFRRTAPRGGKVPMTIAGASPNFPAMSIAQAHALLNQPGSMFEIGEADIRGVKTKIWKNAPPTLAALFDLVAPWGPRDYLVLEDERATFDAFRRAACAFAAQLQADG